MESQVIERSVLVFSTWTNRYGTAFAGILLVMAAFVTHVVINTLYRTGYTAGETALGLATFGVVALLMVVGFATGQLDERDFLTCLSLVGVLVVGFISYLATRYGLRGAYSTFHHNSKSAADASHGKDAR
mgnify:CR=1 FL=1